MDWILLTIIFLEVDWLEIFWVLGVGEVVTEYRESIGVVEVSLLPSRVDHRAGVVSCVDVVTQVTVGVDIPAALTKRWSLLYCGLCRPLIPSMTITSRPLEPSDFLFLLVPSVGCILLLRWSQGRARAWSVADLEGGACGSGGRAMERRHLVQLNDCLPGKFNCPIGFRVPWESL